LVGHIPAIDQGILHLQAVSRSNGQCRVQRWIEVEVSDSDGGGVGVEVIVEVIASHWDLVESARCIEEEGCSEVVMSVGG
jgi:hypothetical protein